MVWVYLIIAGLFEVVWAYFMKQSAGFTKFWPSVLTIVTMLISFFLLSWSMKSLPLGTAYAIWTGIGAIGAFAVGVFWLGESVNTLRVISVLLVVSGLVGLKLSSGH